MSHIDRNCLTVKSASKLCVALYCGGQDVSKFVEITWQPELRTCLHFRFEDPGLFVLILAEVCLSLSLNKKIRHGDELKSFHLQNHTFGKSRKSSQSVKILPNLCMLILTCTNIACYFLGSKVLIF